MLWDTGKTFNLIWNNNMRNLVCLLSFGFFNLAIADVVLCPPSLDCPQEGQPCLFPNYSNQYWQHPYLEGTVTGTYTFYEAFYEPSDEKSYCAYIGTGYAGMAVNPVTILYTDISAPSNLWSKGDPAVFSCNTTDSSQCPFVTN